MEPADRGLAMLTAELGEKLAVLTASLSSAEGLLVAVSGGVDSSLLLAAALRAGVDVLAVTLTSSLQPGGELDVARTVTEQLGARHEILTVDPLSDPELRANPPERCYLCKRRLFSSLLELADARGLSEVVDGSNVDDDDDYRPGKRALEELGVRSPLQRAGLTKADIRELARAFGLPNWNRPAAACLASRVPYGEELTAERLTKIDRGETILRAAGFAQVRLRDHGTVARIEVPYADISRLVEGDRRQELLAALKGLGYGFVALDLEGYRTGAMNEGLGDD